MNFKPKFIKTLLAITVGFMSAFHFRDLCTACSTTDIKWEMLIGFLPAFLWTYGLVSLVQIEDFRTEFKYFLIAVPFVIIFPLGVGIGLELLFNL